MQIESADILRRGKLKKDSYNLSQENIHTMVIVTFDLFSRRKQATSIVALLLSTIDI